WGVSVNRVTRVNENVSAGASHRLVQAHPADIRIDAPALTHRIGGPHNGDIARRPAGSHDRRGESPADRLTPGAEIGQTLKTNAVENPLIFRQIRQVEAGGEIGRF